MPKAAAGAPAIRCGRAGEADRGSRASRDDVLNGEARLLFAERSPTRPAENGDTMDTAGWTISIISILIVFAIAVDIARRNR